MGCESECHRLRIWLGQRCSSWLLQLVRLAPCSHMHSTCEHAVPTSAQSIYENSKGYAVMGRLVSRSFLKAERIRVLRSARAAKVNVQPHDVVPGLLDWLDGRISMRTPRRRAALAVILWLVCLLLQLGSIHAPWPTW